MSHPSSDGAVVDEAGGGDFEGFEYEPRDAEGRWWRSHGNEHWEFDENGLMRRRDASIHDYEIDESERKFRWEQEG